jgi:hypothetical protein
MPLRTLVVLLAGLLAAASASAQSADLPRYASEELICERPARDHSGPPRSDVGVVGSDLQKVVWQLRRGGSRNAAYVIVNGEGIGPTADEFLDPVLSPDGQHVLRAGRQGKAWFVFLDGDQLAGPLDEIRGLRFAPDGRALFAGRRAKVWAWFVERQEQPVTGVEVGAIAVSGQRVAYAARQADGWHVVADGQQGPALDAVMEILFSPDGSRLACLVARGDRMVVVVDGKEEPARAGVVALRWSADSKRLAYVGLDPGKDGAVGQVVVDGLASRLFPAMIQNIVGEMRAAVANLRSYGNWSPPEPRPYLTGASAPVFRSDGKLVYAARVVAPEQRIQIQGGGLSMVPGLTRAFRQEGIFVEGSERPLFPASLVAAGPVLSEVGERAAWVEWDAADDKWIGFVAGQPEGSVSSVTGRANFAQQLTLSRDGSRVAFVHVAESGVPRGAGTPALWQVVAARVKSAQYEAENVLNLRFGDDGRHFAYEVHGARELEVRGRKYAAFVVLDGIPGRAYSELLPGSMRFVKPNAVSYVARVQETGGGPYRYYRVTQTTP